MSTITAILEPDGDGTLHLQVSPEWRHQAIRVNAELELANNPPQAVNHLKGFGALRAKISMSPDFDEPLEDFKDYVG